MKKIELDYFGIVNVVKFITGLDPITGGRCFKNEKEPDKIYGLINEDVTQGVILRLERILKKVKDPFQDFEKQRSELLAKHKGEAETLEGESFEKFKEEFTELAKEIIEIEIETIPFEKVEDFKSAINYSGLIEIICE